jgi:hypothetical protein
MTCLRCGSPIEAGSKTYLHAVVKGTRYFWCIPCWSPEDALLVLRVGDHGELLSAMTEGSRA